jgi:hypothetical protein
LRLALELTVEWSQDRWSDQPEERENSVVKHIREWFHDCTLPHLQSLFLDFRIPYSEAWIQLVPVAFQAEVSARGTIIPQTLAQQLQKLVLSFVSTIEGPFTEGLHNIEVKQIEFFCTLFGVPDQVVEVVLGKGINEQGSALLI